MGNADGSIGGQGGAGGGGGHTQFDLLRELSHIRHELTLINRKFPSLRDQLAKEAMGNYLLGHLNLQMHADPGEATYPDDRMMGIITEQSYLMADAMLKASEPGQVRQERVE